MQGVINTRNYSYMLILADYVPASSLAYLDVYVSFSPNRFICRGSGGFVRGPVVVPRCRLAWLVTEVAVFNRSNVRSPSKTNRKIQIVLSKMDSVREWHHFYEPSWLRSPWEPLGSPGLPDAPQMPSRCSPDAPPDASQMLPRCPSEPSDLSQVISTRISQPSDLSQVI